MAEIEFNVSTSIRPDNLVTDLDVDQVVDRFRTFARDPRTGGPYTILHADGSESQPRTAPEIAVRLRAILPRMGVGERLRVVSEDRERFKVHAVEDALAPVTDVKGSRNVRLWVATLRQKWPTARLAGTCVCKDDSTDKCNGHRDCAAADDFDTWDNMIDQYRFLKGNAEDRGVSYLILGAPGAPMKATIWTYGPPRTFSSRGERPYTGDPHFHLHASFDDGVCGQAC